VTQFTDDRGAEMRELFFETTQELLQSLNDDALRLENAPRDKELIRSIRRTVHTLKGDAAACGFKDLSDLSHLMEDALAVEDISSTVSLAELAFTAADVFAAMTNSEEANILSAMLAKRLGAHKVMALINKPSYTELVESSPIDIAISPQTITIGSLLAHVRRGDVVRVHALKRGAAEALEAVVHGDERSSRIVGRAVADIPLPEGASIGAVVRGEQVIMAHHDTRVLADDHVILFLADRRHLEAVERLFLHSTR